MSIFSYLIIARSSLIAVRRQLSLQKTNMTSQNSKSSLLEIENAVFQYLDGKLDPKYHQNLVQLLLDTDLHLTHFPQMQQYCDYFIAEGFCYYVQQ